MDINKTTAPRETIYAPFKPDEEAPYIFISYSHKDRDRVFPIIKRLYEKGWNVWYDEGLEITENYYTSLSRHIKNCTVFLLFVTENSVKSEFVCEHELLLATSMSKRIAICRLDENAEFTDEAKDAIDIATASKKNPKTDEAGLEAALEGIGELARFTERKAEGYLIDSVNIESLSPDGTEEYHYVKCKGGIRLFTYSGKDTHVTVPKTYKGQPVTELYFTFSRLTTLESVRIPPTVKTVVTPFMFCPNLTDIYIPSTVEKLYAPLICSDRAVIHCAEGSAAHRYAREDGIPFVIDPSLDVSDAFSSDPDSGKYVFCSYAADKKKEAERIIQRLRENGFSAVSAVSIGAGSRNKSYRGAACLIAFVSRGYIEDDEIDYLYRAVGEGKPFVVYVLDDSTLPDDLRIALMHEQQLRFDSGTEEDRIAKLSDWLAKQGCKHISLDIPGFDYTFDKDGGIVLTYYNGTSEEVTVPATFANHPITALSHTFSYKKVTAVTISRGITRIGDSTFGDCSELETVIIPEGVTEIGENAFSNCSRLVSIRLPDSVRIIEYRAFARCRRLRSLTIPAMCMSIGEKAFSQCSELIVYCHKDSDAWKYCEKNGIRHKPIEEQDITDQ